MSTQTGGRQTLRSRVQRAVRSAVIPHVGNDFRPTIVRTSGLAVILLLVGMFQFVQYGLDHSDVLGRTVDITRARLLVSTNEERRDNGRMPLELNQELNKAAELKARDMFANQYWDHVSPSGVEPWQWFSQAGYSYTVAGENLARGFESSRGVTKAWMNSPEHRANLLKNEYQDVGFAVVEGRLNNEATMLVVALYGEPSEGNQPLATASVLAASGGPTNTVASIGLSLQKLSPLTLGSITLLLLASAVAMAAHAYRHYLPRRKRVGLYRHHGIYKALSMSGLVVVILALYSGGTI